jgi:hypothetical protein
VFSISLGHFCPLGSGSRLRIRIHGTHWILIHNTAGRGIGNFLYFLCHTETAACSSSFFINWQISYLFITCRNAEITTWIRFRKHYRRQPNADQYARHCRTWYTTSSSNVSSITFVKYFFSSENAHIHLSL